MLAKPKDLRVQWESPQRDQHAYFQKLLKRPTVAVAALRSQAELDALRTEGEQGGLRLPVVYDPAMDAALWRAIPSITCDMQQKIVPFALGGATSMLITWDCRFSASFKNKARGYLDKHKAYRIERGTGVWIALKTNYQDATNAGQGVAQFHINSPGKLWLVEGESWRVAETLFPRASEFFIEPDIWTRIWFLLEDIGQPVSRISAWAADSVREPIRLYNRTAYKVPPAGLDNFRFEFDSSAGDLPLHISDDLKIHHRNFAVLPNVTEADMPILLERPKG